jgi:protein-tyrosine phosphatase
MSANRTMTILFVCTGNTCRSPMAAAYFQHLCEAAEVDVSVESAGLTAFDGEPLSEAAAKALNREGVDTPTSRSRQLTDDHVTAADLIVTMTHAHLAQLQHSPVAAPEKTFTLMSFVDSKANIDDPFGGNVGEYRQCLTTMKPALDALLEHVNKRLTEPDS